MSKPPATIFRCTKCDAQFPKWAGQCSECRTWGTLTEDAPTIEKRVDSNTPAAALTAFSSLSTAHASHDATGLDFWDRALSGGLVKGSMTLLGGEPGIGKSTLLAQLGVLMANNKRRVVYVTGEESPTQVVVRLKRLSATLPPDLFFVDETRADVIAATIRDQRPALTIVDSVQSISLPTVAGEAGNPTQIKASAATIHDAAKQSNSAVILVGQVTKDGDLAGPRLLEHLVDSVLMLEGDRFHSLRLLRVIKHRFGACDESVILSLNEKGLQEVLDPSAALLADRPTGVSGSVVSCLVEGSRALLVEIQALVTPAGYGTPARRVSGVDTNRVNLVIAVLGRRADIALFDQDVFVNAVGGMDAKDPSIDLAMALAIASAKTNRVLPDDLAAWGEIGLSGELRPVPRLEARIKEASRLGFKRIITPLTREKPKVPSNITLLACKNIKEAIEQTWK